MGKINTCTDNEMDQRDIERLAKLEMSTEHHDKRITFLEDEQREWGERINDLSVATARLVITSENLLASTRSQEAKIGLLEKTKHKMIGYFAGATLVISAMWAVISKLL